MFAGESSFTASWKVVLLIAALLMLLTACAPAESTAPLANVNTPTPTPLPTLTPVPTPVPNALYVDAAQDLGAISPLVYGASYGPWVGVTVELMPLAEDSGVTYLRFPGGEWGDQNDLKDYHLDRFINFTRKLNAEPKINVRMPGGSPQQAANLVRYCNVEHDYQVRYWSIGNEPGLYTSYIMYEDYDTERYNREWRQFAEAMRAVDPNIVLIGPEIHQFTGNPKTDPKDESGKDWLREFLQANGDMVDVVSIHRYPFPLGMSGPSTTIDQLRRNTREWDDIIPKLRALIRETTGRDLPVAVSEINSDWTHATGGQATPDSFYNAIWWADVLGRLIRQKVDIVAYFLLQSQTSQGGYGLLARFEPRPTYYVYQLYKRFGEDLLYASSDDPDLSIYAARKDDNTLTLLIINLGANEKAVPLKLDNFTPANAAQVWRFDVSHNAERIGEEELVDGAAVTLPGQSITLYEIAKE